MLSDSSSEQDDTAGLLARSHQLNAYLSLYLTPDEGTPLDQVLVFLLQQQTVDGAWEASVYPPWTDILTALTVQSLLEIGFDQDATWPINQPGRPPRTGGIPQALAYLGRSRTDHGWGQDIYDTCQVLKVFLTLDNRQHVEADIRWGLDYLRRQVAADFADSRDSNWYGPGFYSAALQVLARESRHQTAVAYLLERLAKMQDHACGFFGCDDDSMDMKVFHTADSLLTLRTESLSPHAASVEQAVQWLETVQDPVTGRWGTGVLDPLNVIFTAYAVMALIDFRGPGCSAVDKGLRWLRYRQDRDGRVESIEGTVMALQCFAKVFHTPTSPAVPMRYIVETRSLLNDYERTMATVRQNAVDVAARLDSVRQELDNERGKYFFRLTRRRAAQIGWIVGILTAILPIVIH